MNSEDHKPPKFLVQNPLGWPRDGEQEFEGFDDPNEAIQRAQAIAKTMRGCFVDIYQHATAVRASENGNAADPA